ncbi:MAG: 50S ribosomal protein L25/general stress protein Ctc [Gammaproteobacteria bacterium]|nr:50S ribosomal protein L25/general stress protein Ctc [Gammaproteobacteria bacterium]NNC96930.1 50S ribosomal protein L25/general stress protein Ctc [Gammaproteobacteria bacterium]NNM13345.1 50S ribosomal protein L25/general stress protein Ctc [Gammaproteobacteria bacterium]
MADLVLTAQLRDDNGKGASRRLRRLGWVPGILYGGNKEPRSIALKDNELANALKVESFYSNIFTIKVDDVEQECILKDLQRHPAREEAMHVDLMRIVAGQAIKTTIQLHFIGEEQAPGVKTEGGAFNRNMVDVEITCLPKDLPEFIEVDVSGMHKDETLHLTDLVMPEGVEIVELMHGEGHDQPVISIRTARVSIEPEEEVDEAAPEEAGDAPAEGEADA